MEYCDNIDHIVYNAQEERLKSGEKRVVIVLAYRLYNQCGDGNSDDCGINRYYEYIYYEKKYYGYWTIINYEYT